MRKIVALLFFVIVASQGWATSVSDSLAVVSTTNQGNIDSQQRVDQLALETQAMLEEYRTLLSNTDYQRAYNQELRQQLREQETEIAALREQVAQSRITKTRIVPLMRSMFSALEKFVLLDLPFRQQERLDSLAQLQQRLHSASVSLPDRYRLLLEAFQVENDYGRTIEAYRDSLTIAGQSLSVDVIRIGRIALYYRTLDGRQCGYWDAEQGWQPLSEKDNHAITLALRVAQKQRAPQLLSLPMLSPEG